MNPFSLPSYDPDLYHLREQQRGVERALTAEQRLVPVSLRRPKNPYQKLDELRHESSIQDRSLNKSHRSYSYNRENILELILRKREILLTKKKIEHKKNKISLLDTATRIQEEEHKKATKALEDNLLRVEKYEESLKVAAKKKSDKAEKKMKKRIERQQESTSLQQQIDYLYGAVERKNEELRQLCVLKDFVQELSSSHDVSKNATFVTATFEELYTPSNLLQSINSLEKKNVFLITQAQDAEMNLENLKASANAESKTLNQENDKLKQDIKSAEKSKEIVNSKLIGMMSEHVEKPLISEETMQMIHNSLVDMFAAIGGDLATLPSEFEILEALENAIRAEIDKTKLLDEEVFKAREREIDKDRRFKNVEALKLKEQEKNKEIAEIMERRKKKVMKKLGRKGMERSKIPEKAIVKERVVVPQEILDRREFLEEYIPYP